MPTSPQSFRKGSSGLLERSLPLIALTLPTVLSVTLIATSHLRILGSMRQDIQNHQMTVSVFVQLISATMGTLQVTALTSVISASFRLRLATQPMQLKTIGVFNAIIVRRIPWKLPLQQVLIAVTMVVLASAPGALWAGSLTPAATSAVETLGSVAVPIYTDATADVWNSEFGASQDQSWELWGRQYCTSKLSSGDKMSTISISNCPAPNYQAQLLQSARDASAGGGVTTRSHYKPDSPAWTYRGRSYGVGAAQGLVPLQGVPAHYDLLSYTYNEMGYQTTVECELNTTAALNLTLISHVKDPANINVWEVMGTLPNSLSPQKYPVIAWRRDTLDNSAVLAWAGVSNKDSHMIGVVASEMYGQFNNIQCTVTFEPALFNVNINSTDQSINVSVVDILTGEIPDIDQTGAGNLRRNAIRSVNLLSSMSTSLYVSVLGEALAHNLDSVRAGFSSGDDAAIRAACESFTAMLDDILGIYGGSQLILADVSAGQTATAVRGSFAALRAGQPWYQGAVLGVNTTLLLLILAEGLRTRWWRGLPCFDTLDFENVFDATISKGLAVAGVWVLQWGGEEGRRVIIKMVGDGPGEGMNCEAGAVNGPYMKVTDSEETASHYS